MTGVLFFSWAPFCVCVSVLSHFSSQWELLLIPKKTINVILIFEEEELMLVTIYYILNRLSVMPDL